MDLINEAIVPIVDDGAFQKPGQKKRASGTVDTRKPCHDSSRRQNGFFGLAQNSPFRVAGLSRGEFIDNASVLLRVNTRAAGEQHRRARKSAEQVLRAIEVEPPILFLVAATRADAMNDDIELA